MKHVPDGLTFYSCDVCLRHDEETLTKDQSQILSFYSSLLFDTRLRRSKEKDTIAFRGQEYKMYRNCHQAHVLTEATAETRTCSRRLTSAHLDIRGSGTRAPSRWCATVMFVKLDQRIKEKISNPTRKFLQVFDENNRTVYSSSRGPVRRLRGCSSGSASFSGAVHVWSFVDTDSLAFRHCVMCLFDMCMSSFVCADFAASSILSPTHSSRIVLSPSSSDPVSAFTSLSCASRLRLHTSLLLSLLFKSFLACLWCSSLCSLHFCFALHRGHRFSWLLLSSLCICISRLLSRLLRSLLFSRLLRSPLFFVFLLLLAFFLLLWTWWFFTGRLLLACLFVSFPLSGVARPTPVTSSRLVTSCLPPTRTTWAALPLLTPHFLLVHHVHIASVPVRAGRNSFHDVTHFVAGHYPQTRHYSIVPQKARHRCLDIHAAVCLFYDDLVVRRFMTSDTGRGLFADVSKTAPAQIFSTSTCVAFIFSCCIKSACDSGTSLYKTLVFEEAVSSSEK